jgi:hypothetical protein
MKVKLLLVLCCLISAGVPRVSAEDANPSDAALQQQFIKIDLELALQQYREVQMEKFKTNLQLQLLETEGVHDEAALKRERNRLSRRSKILAEMSAELRQKADHLRREIVAAR